MLLYAAREPEEGEAGLSPVSGTQYVLRTHQPRARHVFMWSSESQESAYILYVGPIDSISQIN